MWGRRPDAVLESEVVLRMGPDIGSMAGGLIARGEEGFDFDLPIRKKSRNVGADAFADFGSMAGFCGASASGDGFEWAGGKK